MHIIIKIIYYITELKKIKPGVPQGTTLGPILYLLHISDILKLENYRISYEKPITIILE